MEDRRPASHADPYKIVKVISDTLNFADELYKTLQMMYNDIKIEEIENKYGTITNEELLKDYKEE